MAAATLDSKGRITVPAALRVALGLKPGDRIAFIQTTDGAFTITTTTNSVTALKGLVAKPSRFVSVADMNATIAERGKGSG